MLRSCHYLSAGPQLVNIPLIEARFDALLPIHNGPPHRDKPAGGKFNHHHIVLPIGAVADQQIASAVPAHDNPHVGSPAVEGDVPRQGPGLGLLCQIGPNVPVSIAVQPGVTQAPVNQARAVQAKGPVGTGGGIPRGNYLDPLAPAAASAYV